MMAMTTSNSIRVKPVLRLLLGVTTSFSTPAARGKMESAFNSQSRIRVKRGLFRRGESRICLPRLARNEYDVNCHADLQ